MRLKDLEMAPSSFWRREGKREEVSIRNVERGRGEILRGKKTTGRVGTVEEEAERGEGERRGMRD